MGAVQRRSRRIIPSQTPSGGNVNHERATQLRQAASLPSPGDFGTMPDNIIVRRSQYVRQFKKWGLSKNAKRQQYEFVAQRLKKRKRDGKEDSDVYINGALVDHKKLKKELSRHVTASFDCLPITGRFNPS